MKVKDFMITSPVTVTSDTTLRELLQKLVEKRIGGAPVVDESGKLLGMISDGDVIRYIKPSTGRVYDFFTYVIQTETESLDTAVISKLQTTVNHVMVHKNLYTVSPEDPLERAIEILGKHHFKKIPVVDDNRKIVGVISRGDVIRQLVNSFVLKP
ncbi:CBS domain-containing protein [Paenibacillus sp. J22TS3]|uniref:CBS domain-containing protein n=1 Tax=Paenibacillus sp. J22TS3 TaxID=2807192 RepID=UPI001B1BE01C|nr:CBS domain-containing protein [Paenibacillus sp. J22TS3]GIP20594.1 CBS domain-containing protein [Paenibacillus sp. J22TS3]